jgi:FKBP-type peptidyl-prolyl cis-trans isomerase
MRRIAASSLLVPLVACAALAGCGSASRSSGSSSSANANAAVTASGAFNKTPTVTIPAKAPTARLAFRTTIKGTGAALASGDSTLANVAVYKWTGTKHSLLANTFTSGPQLIPAGLGLPGLATALKDSTLGSRVVAVLPPQYAYGAAGNSSLGVTGKDTMVWVIDLLQQFAPTASATGTQVSHGGGALPTVEARTGSAPAVTIPKGSPSSKLSVTTLIRGTGPKLENGDTVVAQYVGVNWRTGKVFSQSWPSSTQPAGAPFSFQLGGQVIPGWNDGLPGATVGSRVMLVVPPALGYGPQGGQPSAGIKKTDSLVFVIDILGVQAPSS